MVLQFKFLMEKPMVIDLVFPVLGTSLRTDHAYALYGALSRLMPALHEDGSPFRFLPINGEPTGEGLLRMTEISRLRLRMPDDRIRAALTFANKRFDLDGHRFRLGVPGVMTLSPEARLYSRITTLKNNTEPEPFLNKVREKLAESNIVGEASIPLTVTGPRAGELKRRVMRVHDRTIVGFALIVDRLSASDSIRLQSEGLGGRTQMGAGFFVPANGEESL